MWPCGVALAAEAWPSATRPTLAGLIGAAANVGFLVLGLIMLQYPVTPDSWRWVLLLGAAPLGLGFFVLHKVVESPLWLEQRNGPAVPATTPFREILRPPLLRFTLLGIALGTVPLLGGWASGQRLVPWAGQIAEQQGLPQLKAATQTVWAVGAVLGSLMGGWLASRLGRRLSYFLISLGSLLLSGYIFLGLRPNRHEFLGATFALGLVSTSFFGWLPYFLPELFPTRVRATGTGISYNFGRIFSAFAIMASTALSELFHGDIGRMGAATSAIYVVGLFIVVWIPKEQT
jgi:MFS family permease